MVVDAADTEKVQIVLQNVSIDCSDHAALFIKQADKVFLTLAEGTENTLSSGSSYALGDDDSNVDGVIFSRADLTMNGSGSLAVNAAYKHAVVSKDDLVVTGGQYAIKQKTAAPIRQRLCQNHRRCVYYRNRYRRHSGQQCGKSRSRVCLYLRRYVRPHSRHRCRSGGNRAAHRRRHVPDHQRRRQCKRQHRQIRKGFARLGYVGASERAESLTGCRIHRHIRQRKS